MGDELLPILIHLNDGDEEEDSPSEVDMEDDVPSSNLNRANDISYDTSLPAQHTYLGNDLEELSGRTVLEDNCLLDLPLLMLSNVVLVPGYTLPLQLYHPAAISMMKRAIDKDKTFGYINRWQMGADSLPKSHVIGTTAEVLSYKEVLDDDTGFMMMRVKAEGRQRFEVLESRRQLDGTIFAKCCILPEISLSDSLDCVGLQSSFKFTKTQQSSVGVQRFPTKINIKHQANFTWWPLWVYQQYNAVELMNGIKNEIKNWDSELRLDNSPSDATQFSYWIAANIPIEDDFKLGLLSLNSAIQRLRAELSILKRYSVLACKVCHHEISKKDDVFSMSTTGPQGTYVNPGGFVHEIITSHHASGLVLRGRPSTEQSWFPGYAWIVAECGFCRSHMGWKFVTVDKKMKPETFWGLCRSAVQPHFQSDEERRWMPCI